MFFVSMSMVIEYNASFTWSCTISGVLISVCGGGGGGAGLRVMGGYYLK